MKALFGLRGDWALTFSFLGGASSGAWVGVCEVDSVGLGERSSGCVWSGEIVVGFALSEA